jgi:hypothetical protein
LIIFVFLLLTVAPGVYAYLRKINRAHNSYERSLELVPLLIHLPPESDDIEGNGRDTRDVTEENISKAQTLYGILASTYNKDRTHAYYGQKHISFEIVAMHGFVYFYVAVPVSLVEITKQAIVSSYPSAQLEEVEEHNIFNQVGKLSAVSGGELSLRESFVYPIATYQELKRDSLQSLLNSLSELGKEDGVGIQIMIRPASSWWQKTAQKAATDKRKGNHGGSGFTGFLKDLGSAFLKTPEEGAGSKPSESLSGLDQAIVDSIEDKSRYPGFETQIRVVTSSNIEARSQSLLANVIAAFQLFDAPSKNGFVFKQISSQEIVTSYMMRFFNPTKRTVILNSVELSTIFHFPDQRNIPTSQLERQTSKQVDGPRNIPDEGLMLGYNIFRGVKKPIRLSLQDRQRHIYAVGQTGTGKSTFLEDLALQDMLNGNGFAFVDPHGDVVDRLLAMVPRERAEDIIYFNPSDMDYPMGLNLFEYDTPDQKDFLIQEVLNMLYKLYDPQHSGIMGPRYESIFRNCALAIMADPNGGTFVDVPKLFRDPQFLKQKLQHVKDQNVLDYWLKEYPASQRSNDAGEVTAWFVSKFGAFLSNEMMRNIIGQTKSAFDLRHIMDNKKILLVNLSKGRTGDLNSKLLGMIFVMKFNAAAMSRADTPEDERQDFCLYVDEFQNFSTDSFATIMSEARKFHLNLIVANQFTTQLTEEIRDAVFGNMGTVVSFRIGQNDVDSLVRYFQPAFDSEDLLRIPNHNAIVRTLVGGVPTSPFSMATLPPLGKPNQDVFKALKQLSAAKYGRPRAEVEKEIFERMSPKPAVPAGFQGGFPQPYAGVAGQSAGNSGFGYTGSQSSSSPADPRVASPATPKPASFLDQWLSKKGSNPGAGQKLSPSQQQLDQTSRSMFDSNSNKNTADSTSGVSSNEPKVVSPMSGSATHNNPAGTQQHSQKVAAEPGGNKTASGLDGNINTAIPNTNANRIPAPSKPANTNTEGEIHLHQDIEDDIFIDNNGELHHREDAK